MPAQGRQLARQPCMSASSSDQPNLPATKAPGRVSLGAAAVLVATWFLAHAFLLAHNPLTRAIALGAELAKEKALQAIPQELMGGLAQPVIQLINQYVGPYAVIGEALMGTWASLLAVLLPASFLLLGFGLVQGLLLLTGGAPGGWKSTARAILINHACADLAALAWAALIFILEVGLLAQWGLLLGGLLLLRLGAHLWLLVALIRVHSMGALRIVLLGLPVFLLGLSIACLLTILTWAWLASDLAFIALG